MTFIKIICLPSPKGGYNSTSNDLSCSLKKFEVNIWNGGKKYSDKVDSVLQNATIFI